MLSLKGTRGQYLLRMLWLSCILLICGCAVPQKQEGQSILALQANRPEGQGETAVADLKHLYEEARSASERRAICLRGIDEGIIHRGVSVATVDEIFGTHFASDLPTDKEIIRGSGVLFEDQYTSPPTPKGEVPQAVALIGWYLMVDYDRRGTVQSYALTNLHKGASSYQIQEKTLAVAELKRLYEEATSEAERRALCLRAIDEGTIRLGVPISTIDGIFGTRFAATLPSGKKVMKSGLVDLALSAPGTDRSQAAPTNGWALVVFYDSEGTIASYRLTNLCKENRP